MRSGNSILSSYGTTIFTVMSALAGEAGAINLGQGFPDGNGPDDIREEAARALREGPNQYPPMQGIPALRQAVAAHNARFYGLEVDWETEVLVTSGATEALAASLLALLEPGDEVVLFEPLYDCYLPIVRLAGARPRFVRLEPPDWRVTEEALRAAFSPKVKLALLNSPMNPTGKVFADDELRLLARFIAEADAYAVCDEVYEHLVYSGHAHRPLMTFPGMRERAIRIGSAGKTFSLTGWKVGYVTAAPSLAALIAKAHQFLTFTTPPNLQAAVAYGLGKEDAYFESLAGDLEAKRDRLAAGLARAGLEVLPTAGTYFITANFRPLGFNGADEAFCRHITTEAKVAAVPVNAFYASDGPTTLARFCFCKADDVLDEAADRLLRHFRK